MNHEEQIEKLTLETRPVYNHQLRDGSDHELVEHRTELQMGMVNRTLYGNHHAAIFAVAELNCLTDPPSKNLLAPLNHQAPASMAHELRKQVNRKNSFPVDRPLE